MLKEIFATLLLTTSIGTPSLQNNGNIWTTQNLLMGTYNYQSEFSIYDLYDEIGYYETSIVFQEDYTQGFLCAWYNASNISGNTEESWLFQLDLILEHDGDYHIAVTFNLFDIQGHTYSYTEYCNDGDSCQDLNFPVMCYYSIKLNGN